MCDDSREQVLEKIRNLLALATDSPSKAEAAAAALAAQRLMARHGVEEAELAAAPAEEVAEVCGQPYSGEVWRGWLATAIADNFRCRAFRRNSGRGSASTHVQVFVGYRTDAEAACLTYEHLAELGARLCADELRRLRRQGQSLRGCKNSFLIGYVEGITNELERQTRALMLVRPAAVDDYFATMSLIKARSDKFRVVSGALEAGQASGRDAVRSSRMEGQLALEG